MYLVKLLLCYNAELFYMTPDKSLQEKDLDVQELPKKNVKISGEAHLMLSKFCKDNPAYNMGGILDAIVEVIVEVPELLPLFLGHLQSEGLRDKFIVMMLEELRGSRGSPAAKKPSGEAARKPSGSKSVG